MTVITNMPMYRAIVVKNGIDLYLNSNKSIIPNRHWTPTNMLKAASEITGVAFKRGQHAQASTALHNWLEVARLKGETLQDVKPMI